MKTVWKYPLPCFERQKISLPAGANALCIRGYDREGKPPDFFLYCQVDTEAEKLPQKIICMITGSELPPDTDVYWLETTRNKWQDGETYVCHWYVEDTI